jgi:hypothetical protein
MGVYYKKSRFGYRATVQNNGCIITKIFTTEEDAARYRDLYIIKNIPNSTFKMNFTWTPAEEEEWAKKLNL